MTGLPSPALRCTAGVLGSLGVLGALGVPADCTPVSFTGTEPEACSLRAAGRRSDVPSVADRCTAALPDTNGRCCSGPWADSRRASAVGTGRGTVPLPSSDTDRRTAAPLASAARCTAAPSGAADRRRTVALFSAPDDR
ncbi:hypothetical protein [Streptomyces sclerotialus]|uniref:hypothetical protein n=1 Tax=Streptomyces sclerotialus TaxID=1957 RepID=UPI0018CA6452